MFFYFPSIITRDPSASLTIHTNGTNPYLRFVLPLYDSYDLHRWTYMMSTA